MLIKHFSFVNISNWSSNAFLSKVFFYILSLLSAAWIWLFKTNKFIKSYICLFCIILLLLWCVSTNFIIIKDQKITKFIGPFCLLWFAHDILVKVPEYLPIKTLVARKRYLSKGSSFQKVHWNSRKIVFRRQRVPCSYDLGIWFESGTDRRTYQAYKKPDRISTQHMCISWAPTN